MDIALWFDNITGRSCDYQKLNTYLEQVLEIEENFPDKYFSKKKSMRKLQKCLRGILEITDTFTKNCHY